MKRRFTSSCSERTSTQVTRHGGILERIRHPDGLKGDVNASAILLSSAFYHSSPKNVGVSTFSTDLLQVLPMNNEVALTSKFVVMAMAKELEGFYFKTTQSFPANSSQNILTIYLQ